MLNLCWFLLPFKRWRFRRLSKEISEMKWNEERPSWCPWEQMKPRSRLTPNIVDNATKTQSSDLRTRPHVTNADVIEQNNVIQFSILHQYFEFILSKSATTSNNKFLCTTTTLKEASVIIPRSLQEGSFFVFLACEASSYNTKTKTAQVPRRMFECLQWDALYVSMCKGCNALWLMTPRPD